MLMNLLLPWYNHVLWAILNKIFDGHKILARWSYCTTSFPSYLALKSPKTSADGHSTRFTKELKVYGQILYVFIQCIFELFILDGFSHLGQGVLHNIIYIYLKRQTINNLVKIFNLRHGEIYLIGLTNQKALQVKMTLKYSCRYLTLPSKHLLVQSQQ